MNAFKQLFAKMRRLVFGARISKQKQQWTLEYNGKTIGSLVWKAPYYDGWQVYSIIANSPASNEIISKSALWETHQITIKDQVTNIKCEGYITSFDSVERLKIPELCIRYLH